MDTLGQRIKARRKALKITQRSLGKALDYSPAIASQWEADMIKPKNMTALAAALRTNVEWLETGKGDPDALTATVGVDGEVVDAKSLIPVPIGETRVPVISYVQAGMWTEICERWLPDGSTEYIQTDIDLSKMAFALEVQGDSMKPEILERDVVIVDPDVQPVPGDYVVAKNGSHEATIKRYRPRGTNEAGEEYFELVPANPDYPTIRSDHSQVMIIGVVMERRVRRRKS